MEEEVEVWGATLLAGAAYIAAMRRRNKHLDVTAAILDNGAMDKHTITLALSDSSRGYEISPERVPVSVLSEFSKDVADFIKGTARFDGNSIEVSITKGSLALSADDVPNFALFRDLQTMQESGDLSKIDSKRKAIIEKWQDRAKKTQGMVVRIASTAIGKALEISKASNYRDMGAARLVNVERYIKGEIQDLGGISRPNAHVLLPDGRKLTVKTSRGLVQQESINRVYKEAHMRVRGKLNLDTNELTDVELISFVEYAPKFDAQDMEKLVSKGREAWADVEDPAEWVRSLRGDC